MSKYFSMGKVKSNLLVVSALALLTGAAVAQPAEVDLGTA
ncbi:MAG: hypothetical protein JWR15_1336, partial [Prosthecobacter sp.]|nr:hypothetical protein [Prosthecobacter sp.]